MKATFPPCPIIIPASLNGGLKRKIPEDANLKSPSKLRKTTEKLTKENAQIEKKLQATRMKNVRLKRKVKSLKG